MNASFVVQGLGMFLGALLLSPGLLCVAARAGALVRPGRRKPWRAAVWVRVLMGAAGAGTMVVGFVPEDAGAFLLHFAGAVAYFLSGGAFVELSVNFFVCKEKRFILVNSHMKLQIR
jgi:hypothetical protein